MAEIEGGKGEKIERQIGTGERERGKKIMGPSTHTYTHTHPTPDSGLCFFAFITYNKSARRPLERKVPLLLARAWLHLCTWTIVCTAFSFLCLCGVKNALPARTGNQITAKMEPLELGFQRVGARVRTWLRVT